MQVNQEKYSIVSDLGSNVNVPNFSVEKKDNLLSFISSENLRINVCISLRDKIIKLCKDIQTAQIYGNYFFCYKIINEIKYKLFEVSVEIDQEYNILIFVNRNEFKINNLSETQKIIDFFGGYISKLMELYQYVNQNYEIVYENNLAEICVRGNRKCIKISCCECECNKKNKYQIDYVNSRYVVYENYEIKFECELLHELDSWKELSKYKNKICCCC